MKTKKGLWYLLPEFIRERLEVPSRYEFKRELLEIIGSSDKKKLKVLDAGAGDCFAKKFFTGHQYISMDIKSLSPQLADASIDVVGDVQNIPFETDSFDMVLLLEVLEHVPYPQKALQEAARVLKPNGALILSVPLMATGFHGDFYRFTPWSLNVIFESANLKIRELKPTGGYFRMLGWQISKLSYFIKKPQKKTLWPLYYMIKIPVGFVFQVVIPLFLFWFDRFDKEKKQTNGYIVVARKNYVSKKA